MNFKRILLLTLFLVLAPLLGDTAAAQNQKRMTVKVHCPPPPNGNGQIDQPAIVKVTVKQVNPAGPTIEIMKYFGTGTNAEAMADGIADALSQNGCGATSETTNHPGRIPYNTRDVQLPAGWEFCEVWVWKKTGGWVRKGDGDHVQFDIRKKKKTAAAPLGYLFQVAQLDSENVALSLRMEGDLGGSPYEFDYHNEFPAGTTVQDALQQLADELSAEGFVAWLSQPWELAVYLPPSGLDLDTVYASAAEWSHTEGTPEGLPLAPPPTSDDSWSVFFHSLILVEGP